MAAKPNLPKPPQAKPKPVKYTPADRLRGGTTVGSNYTAWDTYGQGKPDFGKDVGPGDPYHEVSKKVAKPLPGSGQVKPLPWGTPNQSRNSNLPNWVNRAMPSSGTGNNAWIDAVRRRLKGA